MTGSHGFVESNLIEALHDLKMPHLAVSGIYMGLQAVCCALYFAWPGYTVLFIEAGVLSGMYLLFMKKYFVCIKCQSH